MFGNVADEFRSLFQPPAMVVNGRSATESLPCHRKPDVPLFHFEVRTETHVMLTEGIELPDLTAARVEAAQRIGQLLHDHANQIWADEDWRMDVTDERGLILYVLQVSAMKSAATN